MSQPANALPLRTSPHVFLRDDGTVSTPAAREQAEHDRLCARRCSRCGFSVNDPEPATAPYGRLICADCLWIERGGR